MQAIINGTKCDFNNDKYLVEVLTLQLTKNFPFQTLEAIQINMVSMLELIREGLELTKSSDEDVKKEITNLKRKITKHLETIPKIRNKEVMIKTIYNFILSLDGLSTLNGFGVCSTQFGDKIRINPEKESIRKIV